MLSFEGSPFQGTTGIIEKLTVSKLTFKTRLALLCFTESAISEGCSQSNNYRCSTLFSNCGQYPCYRVWHACGNLYRFPPLLL